MTRMLLFLAPFVALGLAGGAAIGLYGPGVPLPDAGQHGAWYASRAAGVASYLFIWIGLVGGLLMSSAWFDGIVGRARLLAIHQTASTAGVLLGFGHALILIPDGWTTFGLIDVLVPFGSYYERFMTGVGSLALYLGLLVSVSFWFRKRLGMKVWRYLHYTSFLVYVGALWHGLSLGTDASEPWLVAVYVFTSLLVVFGLVVRLTYSRAVKARPAVVAANRPTPTA